MASRRSQYVTCPFYKSDDPLRIKCEGCTTGIISLHLIFGLRAACQDHINRFCNDRYKNCRVYLAIIQKYE